jgi:hypothetical protein
MPKRSNIFQRLVKLLHEKLDENWVVSESEMLTHRLTNEEREVDIVLKYKLGNHDVIVSIECTDTKRPASSTWVETMAKKHDFLPTSKLVLWSASGFYKPAITTAEKLGIDIVSQSTNNDLEWSKFSKILNDGFLKLVHSEFTFFIDVVDTDGNKIRLDNPYNYIFKVENSETYFSILQLREYIMHQQEVGSVLLDHASNDQKDFWLQFVPPFECQVQKENGNWVKPFRIGFGIKTSIEETKTESKTIEYEKTLATLAVGKLKSGSFELFVEEKENENPKLTAQLIEKNG